MFYANPMGLDTGTGKANTGTGNQNTGIEYVGIEITGGMKVISDEDLKAWHKGIEIVDHVYEVTS